MEKAGMEAEAEAEGPSLPSNYVTILQLKERWLRQQKQQNYPKPSSDSHLNPKSNHDSPPEIPNPPLPRRRHRHRAVNQLKPQVTVHDSGSKTLENVSGNHSKAEKQEHNTDHSISKLSTKNYNSRRPKPRSITDRNLTGDGTRTPGLEPGPAVEKKLVGGFRSRNQVVVGESRDKRPPLAQNVDGLSHDDARGDAAVAVKESNVPSVSQGTHRRGGSVRFHGSPRFGPSKSSLGMKKGQVSLVWVKKGESAPN